MALHAGMAAAAAMATALLRVGDRLVAGPPHTGLVQNNASTDFAVWSLASCVVTCQLCGHSPAVGSLASCGVTRQLWGHCQLCGHSPAVWSLAKSDD